jgi:hypothetical protein
MRHVFPRDMVLPTSIDVYRHEHAKPQRIRLNGDLVVADDPTPSPFLPAVGRDELCWVVSYERVARVRATAMRSRTASTAAAATAFGWLA